MVEYFVGAADNRLGHAGKFGDMYAEAVFATSASQFAQEHDLAVDLFDGNVEVDYAVERTLHFVQFVIVSGKQRFRADAGRLVDVLDNGPCD